MKLKLGNLLPGLGSRGPAPQQVEATVLFADICGSTRLFEQRGDFHARQVIARALDILAAKTADQGGEVIKTIGDEIIGFMGNGVICLYIYHKFIAGCQRLFQKLNHHFFSSW